MHMLQTPATAAGQRDNAKETSQMTRISGERENNVTELVSSKLVAHRDIIMLPSPLKSAQIMQNSPYKWPRYPECTDLKALTQRRRNTDSWDLF